MEGVLQPYEVAFFPSGLEHSLATVATQLSLQRICSIVSRYTTGKNIFTMYLYLTSPHIAAR